MIKYILLFIFIFSKQINIVAQTQIVTNTEQLFFETIAQPRIDQYDEAIKTSYTSNLVFFFLFYKKIFSRNDMPSTCKFHPSCGSYSSLAIQKNGLIKGVLKTFDRLQRCNGTHSVHQYKYLPSSDKYIDQP